MVTRKTAGIGGVMLLWALFSMQPDVALGEGTNELGSTQDLLATTPLYVDILDAGSETIQWTGNGSVTVFSPGEVLQGTISSGGSMVPAAGTGAYQLVLSENQTGAWDVTVVGAATGRLFSYQWDLNTASPGEPDALNMSFYSLLENVDGITGNDLVIETKLDGYAGWHTEILANGVGLGGTPPGLSLSSAPEAGVTADPGFPLYLNPPERANYNYQSPTLAGAGLDASILILGSTTVTVDFQSNVSGHAFLMVDLDQDGTMDRNTEVVAVHPVSAGANQIVWDGTDPFGDPLVVDTYDLQINMLVGLHSFLSVDVETSYEGFRQFVVDEIGGRVPLAMYWNDEAVYINRVWMPNFEYGLETAGPDGIHSGLYFEDASPNINARSWGDFSTAGRGNAAILNTFTFVEEDIASLGSLFVSDDLAWFEDYDEDGFGNPAVWMAAPTQPSGYVADNTDCDDTNDTVYPGAPEVCGDGLDNNCNGEADEGCQFWFEDFDADGYGNPAVYVYSQTPPPGFVADYSDCDDTNDFVYPGAPEICDDGLDNDCNGLVDDGCEVLEIMTVSDVGNDQGRQVRLAWARSPEDASATTYTVTDYSVYRRVDQYKSGETWDFLASVPAHGLEEYNTVVPTLCDSTDAGICWSVFFVRARTTDPLTFFDTLPDSGWSVDNLAPFPPENPLMAGSMLQWDPFLDEDARYATVYGSSSGLMDGSEVVLGYATGTDFDVIGQPHPYYLVSVTDFAGNEGEPAVIVNDVSGVGDFVPVRTALVGNAPNPFNPSTVIVFELAAPGPVDLKVYDVAGRLVRTLEAGTIGSVGRNEVPWDGRNDAGQAASAGIYFCRMTAGDYNATVRMALVK